MRKMIPSLMALAALCVGTPNPVNAQPPPVPEIQVVKAAVAQAQQQANAARQQTGQAAEDLVRAQRAVELARAQLPAGLRQADRALQLAQATVALAQGAEPAEPATVVAPVQPEPPHASSAARGAVPGMPGGAMGSGVGLGNGMGAGVGGAGSVAGFGGGGFFAQTGRNSGQPLIIRAADSNAATTGEIQEDMTVMSHILTKALADRRGDDAQNLAMGIVVSALGGDQRPQSFYLDGYGALFLLNVRMALLPPPPTKETEKKEAPVDTTWEQTKREIYGGEPGPGGSAEMPGWRAYQNSFSEMQQRRYGTLAGGSPPVEYDAQKVESLKRQLLEALKNASNIRHLKSDEWVTVAVSGPGGNHAVLVKRRIRTATPGATASSDRFVRAEGGDASLLTGVPHQGTGQSSTLTIRVKKADVDTFAKSKLSFEEFQRKASIVTY
ncbi:MAG: hypothetical protein ACYDH9_08635 [Limisphaerales bacterium]